MPRLLSLLVLPALALCRVSTAAEEASSGLRAQYERLVKRQVPATGVHMCFACTDIPHLKYCDNVVACQAGEICFVSSRTSSTGHVKYRAGCVNPSVCSIGKRELETRQAGGPCLTCCNNDFCNSKGCGDPGFAAPQTRGPLCLDCSQVEHDTECDQVKLCKSNEECSIEESSFGAFRLYEMGCKGKGLCALGFRRSAGDREGRASVCHACCPGDFCNRNCTAGANPIG